MGKEEPPTEPAEKQILRMVVVGGFPGISVCDDVRKKREVWIEGRGGGKGGEEGE